MLEAVIGLEVHVQPRTATKMFCGNAVEFAAEPNTHVCPVCLGLPGALPVVNARAVELGVRAALGLRCTVHARSAFARKSYFYPDLPKGYQITQHDRPLATGGWLELPGGEGEPPRRIRIRRLHLEEDTAKSLHDRVGGATALDLNRAGVPLLEIVTEPDLRSPAEARALLARLRQALQYLEVGECSMEEGSLRVDANVSLRRPGEPLGTRTEIKNLNSFAGVERALRYEIRRQREVLARGGEVEPLTLLWDAGAGEARPLRSKEETRDYRYFPEPDLPPLVLPAEALERARADLPEMPWDRVERLRERYGLPASHAGVLCSTRELGDFYEAVVAAGADPREAAHWVRGEVRALLNASGAAVGELRFSARDLAELLGMLASGAVARPAAKRALARMAARGGTAAEAVRELGVHPPRGDGEVERWVERVLEEHPEEVRRYRGGDARLLGFFIGRVMRWSGGGADPREVEARLRDRLAE